MIFSRKSWQVKKTNRSDYEQQCSCQSPGIHFCWQCHFCSIGAGRYRENTVIVYKHRAVRIRFLSCFSDFHIHCRNDLELQFSCYDHTDKQEVCNWPNGVSVSINEKKLQIDRVCHYSQHPDTSNALCLLTSHSRVIQNTVIKHYISNIVVFKAKTGWKLVFLHVAV